MPDSMLRFHVKPASTNRSFMPNLDMFVGGKKKGTEAEPTTVLAIFSASLNSLIVKST